MGTRERREREKEDLRRSILDAARELFVSEGYDAVTMRKIASAIEYSPTTIYLHFADKDAILDALCIEGFEILADLLIPLDSIEHPIARLRRGANVYFEFAQEYRSYYTIMFEIKESPLTHKLAGGVSSADGTVSYRAFDFLLKAMRDGIREGYIPAASIEYVRGKHFPENASVPLDDECAEMAEVILAHVVWAALHGITSLSLAGRLGMMPEELQPLLRTATIETVLSGLTRAIT